MTNRTDNHKQVFAQVASFILANAPEGLRKNDRQCLQDIVAGENRDYAYIDWRRDAGCNSESSMTIRLERVDGLSEEENNGRYGRYKDEEGNIWGKYAIVAVVSWPCYGAATYEHNLERLTLMSEVNEFAKRVMSEFSQEVWTLLETKQERELREETLRAQALELRVTELVESMHERRAMRIGSVRRIEISPEGDDKRFQGLSGDYVVEVGQGKKFQLRVNTHTVYIERTA